MTVLIDGSTAAEIVSSIRVELDTGSLRPGDPLPTARALAERLGVNRNTVVSAYRQLALAGLLVSKRGAGTSVAPHPVRAEEGFRLDTAVTDVGSGNPDRSLIPDPSSIALASGRTVLYGESTTDPGLRAWAEDWFAKDVPRSFEVIVMSGAVDAVERLLAMTLTAGDRVALEDPCFLTSINAVKRMGYRPVGVPVDEEGMRPDGLQAALEGGARVVICTPRAHNPTGVSISANRAAKLRGVISGFPLVLVVEDDHFSMLAASDYHSIVPPGHQNWALVRSMSKFLGPDLRIALVATDLGTAGRLGTQISAGTNWVSHLLQRTAHVLVSDPAQPERTLLAREHYHARNAHFVELLDKRGIRAWAADGLNIWIDVTCDAHAVSEELIRRGWAARTGDEFAVNTGSAADRLRMTVHDLTDDSMVALADALTVSIRVAYTRRSR